MQDLQNIPLNNDLLEQVMQQIKKDLALAGFSVHIEINEFSSFDELRELLKSRLLAQLNNRLMEIKRILYHLDLGNTYFETFVSQPREKAFDYLSELIIKKSLTKVVNRKRWQNNS